MNPDEELANVIAEEVWRGLSCNGSMRINIDTDTQCYGPWAPDFRTIEEPGSAQSWVLHLVRSTMRHLTQHHLLAVTPGIIEAIEALDDDREGG